MNDLVKTDLMTALRTSVYPGAKDESIEMVLAYCRAAMLDPLQKPVHIVPMWDSKSGSMRDVVMPGIGLYRIQAERSGVYAGVSEPEFGPDVTEELGGVTVTYPKWCKISVYKQLSNEGNIATFSAMEFWKENYAMKGGKEKSIAPNAMWNKRVYGQLAKCTEAQALRKAFPELCSGVTAEEAEGKPLYVNEEPQAQTITQEQVKTLEGLITEVKADKVKFLKYLKVQELDLLPADLYQKALTALEGKKKAIEQEKAKKGAAKLVEEFNTTAAAKEFDKIAADKEPAKNSLEYLTRVCLEEPYKELSEADKKFYQE